MVWREEVAECRIITFISSLCANGYNKFDIFRIKVNIGVIATANIYTYLSLRRLGLNIIGSNLDAALSYDLLPINVGLYI